MRLRAVPRVSAGSNRLARVYPRTDRDAHRSALKVSDEHKWCCRPHCNNHMIACDRARTLTHPPSLREGVRNERQLRAAGLVIQFAVDYGNDFARCRRQDWCAEPDKRLRGLRREHRTPASLCRKPSTVDGDEVNRVGRSEQVSAMARNAVRGAVLHNPPTSEGQSQRNRKGIQRSITSSRNKGCGPSARQADSRNPPLLADPPVTDPRASDPNLRGDRGKPWSRTSKIRRCAFRCGQADFIVRRIPRKCPLFMTGFCQGLEVPLEGLDAPPEPPTHRAVARILKPASGAMPRTARAGTPVAQGATHGHECEAGQLFKRESPTLGGATSHSCPWRDSNPQPFP